jgi:hypothetical protein
MAAMVARVTPATPANMRLRSRAHGPAPKTDDLDIVNRPAR